MSKRIPSRFLLLAASGLGSMKGKDVTPKLRRWMLDCECAEEAARRGLRFSVLEVGSEDNMVLVLVWLDCVDRSCDWTLLEFKSVAARRDLRCVSALTIEYQTTASVILLVS